ncbi:type II secretion system F family protein [Herbivorax sp. ANBcel31]|uniref:type II secretion system F family protein n=1 Tax=Herbivorax sp. ANBcel31 TaxID=3069754 RepID=UPI0027ADD59E|nr:type II secretion system F family protein [Herbivorax sp. ANBcel31]MDQ2085843.1 type II secretion system F family protein [Herbivorax sp. ANBcel31]
MPNYNYKVKTESGKVLAGEVKIESEQELRRILQEKGYKVVEIVEKTAINDISEIKLFRKKVKLKDLAVFCRQFAIILEAGVPISQSLEVLKVQTTNPTLKACLSDVYDNIQKGIAMSSAFRQHEDIFPDILINMVEAGELSGQLDLVFIRMANYFEAQYKLNQKIKGALAYPLIVMVVAILVILILMIGVIPTFAEILGEFDVELPVYTSILISISDVFKSFWYIIIGGIIAIVSSIAYYRKTPDGKVFFGKLAIGLPVFKSVTRNIITARFTRTLGTLMSSGVLLIQSMEVVAKVLGNSVVEQKISHVIEEVKKGKGLTTPLASIRYFPHMVISMIRIGEESGNLDFALEKSADFYDQEVERSLQQLTSFIEPLIMISLALVVGFIILSVLTPMFALYEELA